MAKYPSTHEPSTIAALMAIRAWPATPSPGPGLPAARSATSTGDSSSVPKRVLSSNTTGTLLSRTESFFITS